MCSAKVVSYTKPVIDLQDEGVRDIKDIIAFCARVSNPSNQLNTETSDRLLKYLLKHKHVSPFEMANICVEVTTTRDIARQILRHRSMQFQEFCLSGDTDIYFGIPGKFEDGKYKLKDLYEKWNSGSQSNKIPTKEKIQNMLIKCYDEIERKLTSTTIKDIFFTGKKNIYKIYLSDGKQIKTTKEHKFLTKNGFLPLEEAVGMEFKNNKVLMNKKPEIATIYNEDNYFIPKWTTVKYIEYLGQEDTYDIEVNHSSHNYVANGIIVHNSQRYADPVKELEFTLREARLQDVKNRQNSIDVENDDLQTQWALKQEEVIKVAKEAYEWAINNGIAKEQARCVLPEGNTLSRLYINGNIRSWIHYLEARLDPTTQKEHRELAYQIALVISEIFPLIFTIIDNSK